MKRLATTFLLAATAGLCLAPVATAFVKPYFTISSTPFTSVVTSEKVIMKDAAGLQLTCTAGTNEKGEVVAEGSKRAKKIVMKFTGCESLGVKCTSEGSNVGEIKTSNLEGDLGYLEPATEGAKVVAFALKPETAAFIAKYNCGLSAVEVTGCVLTKMSEALILTNKFKLVFEEEKGKSLPEKYKLEIGGASEPCLLESKTGAEPKVREGWEFSDEIKITAPKEQRIES